MNVLELENKTLNNKIESYRKIIVVHINLILLRISIFILILCEFDWNNISLITLSG